MRWLAIAVGTLVVLAVLTAGFAAWLIGTDSGTRLWVGEVDQRLEELELQGVSGNLRDGLRFTELTYSTEVAIVIREAELTVELWPLINLEALNVQRFSAEQIVLAPAAAQTPEDRAEHPLANFALPGLPIPVSVAQATVAQLRYEATELNDIRAQATWDSRALTIRRLQTRLGAVSLDAQASASTATPVQIDLTLSWEQADNRGRLTATGPLTRLNVRHVLRPAEMGPLTSEGTIALHELPAVTADLRHSALEPALNVTSQVQGAVTSWHAVVRGRALDYPVAGELAIELGDTSTINLMRGLVAEHISVRGVVSVGSDTLTADFELASPDLSALGVGIGGDAKAKGVWRDGTLDVALAARTLQYETIIARDVSVALSGTPQALAFDSRWHAGRLSGDAYMSDPGLRINIDRGSRLVIDTFTLSNTSEFEVRQNDQLWSVSPHCWTGMGEICVDHSNLTATSAEIRGRLTDLPLAAANDWIPVIIDAASRLDGDWFWQGGLNDWQAGASISTRGLVVSTADQRYDDLPDLRITASASPAAVRAQLSGTNERYSLDLDLETLGLLPTAAINGTAQLQLSADALKRLSPSLETLGGSIAAEVDIGGTLTEPVFNARGSWDEGAFAWREPDVAFTNINIQWQADNDNWLIEGRAEPREGGVVALRGSGTGFLEPQFSAAGTWSDGKIRWKDPQFTLSAINLSWQADNSGWQIDGTAQPEDGGSLTVTGRGDGYDQSANITADVRASALSLESEYWSVTAVPRATLNVADGVVRFDGTADIPTALVKFKTLPTSLPRPVADVRVRGREQVASEDNKITGSLRINLGKNVRLDLLALTVGLSGTLNAEIEGTEVTALHGELTVTDGSLEASGQTLSVKEGRLLFSGAPTLPYVDLVAVREIDDVSPTLEVGVRVRGRTDALKTTVYSDPVMNETRALSYLVLGRDFNESSDADSNQLLSAAISLGLSQTQGVVQQLRGALGLDELSALAAEQNDVAIVAGKKISNDLYVRYSYNALSAVGALIIRYHLTDRWRLEATNDANSSMDLLYEFSR